MNKDLFKKFLPHLIAIGIFLIVAIIYCSPALQGKVVIQTDITHFKGSVQQSLEYQKTHGGKGPLWTNSLFSGMPAFQIGAVPYNNIIPGYVNMIMTLGLPKPISFFFLACICFYILTQVVRIKPWVGIMGALAFAYATYNPIIISVGHETKMFSIAYMPAVLASVFLIYEKKYLLGAALTALFSATMIAMNHLQIVYYLVITVGIMTIFFVVRWIQQKDFKHLVTALGFTAVAAAIGLFTNSINLLSTYEYQKYTIRGGASYLTDTTTKKSTTSKDGLDEDYAFAYSLAIPEPLVMAVPRMYGGSSGFSDIDENKSKAIEALRAMPEQLQQQLPISAYWGGIADGQSVGTSGPPYAGAIICFLAILGFFLIDKKYKWPILATFIIAIMLSWGSFFKEFNNIVFDVVPFYNKFRAPSMILVIPQLLLPLMAALGVNAFINANDKKALWPQLKKGLIATGALFVVLFLLYMSLGYLSSIDNEILKNVRNSGQQQLIDAVRPFFDGLKADRKSLFLTDIFRSLGFIALAAIVLWLLFRNTIKPIIGIALLTVFVFIDLITIDNNYLKKENYQEKSDNEMMFQRTAYDDSIKADKSYFRVYNYSQDRFHENITSYTLNSIGGYHAAKLRLYQDIIERQLGNNNMAVVNMLNAKYFIQKEENPQSPQYGHTIAMQKNPGALGPCWLVKTVQFVKNADDEMNALNHFNPSDTAFVQESFKSSLPNLPVADSTASIQLVKNDNDVINYSFNAATNQFAVFSEVYYPGGWRAYIDNKEAPIVKTDYVLRGLAIPAGKHNIRFEFKPDGFYKGKKITAIAEILLLILLAGAVFMEWRKRKSK
jgi:hypothetical protein